MFCEVKGRSNFSCTDNFETCDEGSCQLTSTRPKCKLKDKKLSFCTMHPEDMQCPYKIQRDAGKQAQTCVMNFAYFIQCHQGKFNSFPKRRLLIVDESHSLPSWGLEYVSMTLHAEIVGKIPNYINYPDYVLWFDKCKDKVKALIDELPKKLTVEQKRRKTRLENLVERLQSAVNDYSEYKEEWVWELVQDKIKFQPITVGRFMKRLVWQYADKFILMSGTILEPKMFLKEIGLENSNYKVIDVPSTFPVENRPIYYIPVGKMTYAHKATTLPKIAAKVREIILSNGDLKGIIHSHSYQNAEMLYDYLGDLHNRLIFQDDRMESLEKFKKSKNGIFISVAMTEGLDLKDELCRYQILIKLPFMDMSDKRVAKRVNERNEWLWYNLICVQTICQAYGRATRSPTDWSRFYILDESFSNLYSRYKKYFPAWFVEAVQVSEPKVHTFNEVIKHWK